MDVDELAHPSAILKLHHARDLGEQGVVLAPTDVGARLNFGAPLAHDDAAAGDQLAAENLRAGQSGQFLAVIFPHNQMQILPYNRVLKDLNGHTPEQLLKKLAAVFEVKSVGKA